jgi:ABC-type polysaccharide/polyol phosphate export permease
MKTAVTWGLLVKGCLRREILSAPLHALWKHIVLPAVVVSYVSFLDAGARLSGGWPMLAVAGAVWLLFANSVNCGGMMLWHERWLLGHRHIPAGLLLAAAEMVPIGLFAVHLSLIHIGLMASPIPRGGTGVETLAAGWIAAAAGLGAGVLAARLTALRPGFVAALPTLLLASLLLTPVFYRLSALDGLKEAWVLANPLAVATELGRAGISFQPEALPGSAALVASIVSGVILCWGLLTLRLPLPSSADEHV